MAHAFKYIFYFERRNGYEIKKIHTILLSLLLFLPLFLTNFITPNVVLADSQKQDQKIVGYFPSWGIYGRNYQVADIDASKLTHLNYAFADICWNGKHGNPSTHPDNPNKQTWNCKESGVPLQNKEVPNGTLVLGEPWADVTKILSWLRYNLGRL